MTTNGLRLATTPSGPTESSATASEGERPSFADFWLLYPRHVARQAAARAWNRLADAQRIEALVGLVAWATVWRFQAQTREDWLDYVPHPASWLNGARWEDELPARFRPMVDSRSAGSPLEPPVLVRTEMPASVKLALAKLRGAKP